MSSTEAAMGDVVFGIRPQAQERDQRRRNVAGHGRHAQVPVEVEGPELVYKGKDDCSSDQHDHRGRQARQRMAQPDAVEFEQEHDDGLHAAFG